jgi:hypothetical protein
MAASGSFSVTISAVDNVTKTLDGINSKLAKFSQPWQRLGKSIGKFTDVSGLKKMGTALGEVGGVARSAAESMTRIVEPLGVIAGAASIAGMARMVSVWGISLPILGSPPSASGSPPTS